VKRVAAALGLLFLFGSFTAQAQLRQRSEVGGGLGTFNYTGDLVRSYNFLNSQPAATIFYRSNISKVISFRAGLTGGKLKASDRRPIDPAATQRNAGFNIFLMEVSSTFEYHFLDWREGKRRLRFTPYLFGGISMFGISGNNRTNQGYSSVQMAIPFGGGMKYVLNPKWYLAFEFGIRKTFFDFLDGVSDEDVSRKNYQYGNPYDNDNFFFMGLTLTRTFYDIPCAKNPY
jgi:hypothetical protein